MKIRYFLPTVLLLFLCAPSPAQQETARAPLAAPMSACVDDSRLSPPEKFEVLGPRFSSYIVVPSGFLTNASLLFGKKVIHEYVLAGGDSTTSIHLGLTANKMIWAEANRLYNQSQKNGSANVNLLTTDAFGRKLTVNLWKISWEPKAWQGKEIQILTKTALAAKCDADIFKATLALNPALFSY